jgi:hypothetical protein
MLVPLGAMWAHPILVNRGVPPFLYLLQVTNCWRCWNQVIAAASDQLLAFPESEESVPCRHHLESNLQLEQKF